MYPGEVSRERRMERETGFELATFSLGSKWSRPAIWA
jgi:hypothetical protein